MPTTICIGKRIVDLFCMENDSESVVGIAYGGGETKHFIVRYPRNLHFQLQRSWDPIFHETIKKSTLF
jgi:hypothetical protein